MNFPRIFDSMGLSVTHPRRHHYRHYRHHHRHGRRRCPRHQDDLLVGLQGLIGEAEGDARGRRRGRRRRRRRAGGASPGRRGG